MPRNRVSRNDEPEQASHPMNCKLAHRICEGLVASFDRARDDLLVEEPIGHVDHRFTEGHAEEVLW